MACSSPSGPPAGAGDPAASDIPTGAADADAAPIPSAIYRPRPRLLPARFDATRAPKTGVIVVRTPPLPPLLLMPAPIFGADLRAMRDSLRTNAQAFRDSAEQLHRCWGLDACVLAGFSDVDPDHADTFDDSERTLVNVVIDGPTSNSDVLGKLQKRHVLLRIGPQVFDWLVRAHD